MVLEHSNNEPAASSHISSAPVRMQATAVVLQQPEQIVLSQLDLTAPTQDDVVIDIAYSGISTGTEKLLWTGRMPPFPGMGYPLVPGYESVGRVIEAGSQSGLEKGAVVFVPGARCFGDIRGLFGGAASRVVSAGARVLPIDPALQERGVLMALAATAYHAVHGQHGVLPDLIVGHGVLGRLVARLAVLEGGKPVVWERNPVRREGKHEYHVIDPSVDHWREYKNICDVSGDAQLLDNLIARLAPGGEVLLAGFYSEPLSFNFAPAFMREARVRVAAQWQPGDLSAVKQLVEQGALSLDGLITHRLPAKRAEVAYRTAFDDPSCLKMILDWRGHA
jgi:bacteriochlorophyllide a dehydrogenase